LAKSAPLVVWITLAECAESIATLGSSGGWRRVSQIQASVVAAGVLLDLAVFTGRLEGLARWGSGPGGVGECGE
jgi:hypothetical protein